MDEVEISRRRMRQRAVELLYQIELTGKSLLEICEYADPPVLPLQKEWINKIWAERENLDQLIKTASHEWRIDEAVELAKLYSGEEAGRFVNGVLGRIVRETGE